MSRFRVWALAVSVAALASSSVEAAPWADPDSIPPPAIRVVLTNGDTLRVARVGLLTNRKVRLEHLDGSEEFTWTNRIRSVTDEWGDDRTREALKDGYPVWVGGPASPSHRHSEHSKRQVFLFTHGGALVPTGEFDYTAETGFAVDAGFAMRIGRQEFLGLRVDYARLGGTQDVESFINQASTGALDRLGFVIWG
jgi:hypothetical protein